MTICTPLRRAEAPPGRSTVTGYSLLEAASMEDALRVIEGHPHLHVPAAEIDVFEAVPMPGLEVG